MNRQRDGFVLWAMRRIMRNFALAFACRMLLFHVKRRKLRFFGTLSTQTKRTETSVAARERKAISALSPGLRCFACECGSCAWCGAMSRSRGVIRAITVSSSSKRRTPLGGATTGRKGKKHRKMGSKRHFEPVKRAEPRFPENPTNHSSPPARRRQKIAPLRHSSPPTPLLPTQIRRCQTPPYTKSCSHSRTPPSLTFPYCVASPHTTPRPFSPSLWMRHHNSFNPSFGKTPKRHNLYIIPPLNIILRIVF